MAIHPIDSLEPGMILKSAVCDRSGRLLLPAGIELLDKHLKIFRTWGVSEADIEGEEISDSCAGIENNDSGDPAVIAKARQEVEQLFVHNDLQHPMIHELMKLCVSRRVVNAE